MSNNHLKLVGALSPEDSASGQHNHDDSFYKKGDGDGGGNDMLERVKKLEDQVSTLLVDVAIIKSNYSTKADVESVKSELHKAVSAQTKWFVASLFIALGAGLTIAKYIF